MIVGRCQSTVRTFGLLRCTADALVANSEWIHVSMNNVVIFTITNLESTATQTTLEVCGGMIVICTGQWGDVMIALCNARF